MDKITLHQQITLPESHSLLVNTGALSLAVEHKPKEWCIHTLRNKSTQEGDTFELLTGQFSPLIDGELSRYISSESSDTLEIKPTLADRPVVCRPISAITLVPGASVVIYISTPIWLTFSLLGKKNHLLKEVAMHRLSDTWFGASTTQGELCYASQTSARLELENLPVRQQRVTTPLVIENNADTDLLFERIALPVPSLSIFTSENGQLWTQNVTLSRDQDGDFAKLKLGNPQPQTTLVTGPRVQPQHGQIIRAFSAIFN